MQIRAIDFDVISIETKPGEILTIKQDEGGLRIRTASSSFLLADGYLVEHVESGKVKLKRKEK